MTMRESMWPSFKVSSLQRVTMKASFREKVVFTLPLTGLSKNLMQQLTPPGRGSLIWVWGLPITDGDRYRNS